MIQVGENVHIITRRLFAEDVRRHFAGKVRGLMGSLARVEGLVYVFHSSTGLFHARPEVRTRVIDLGDSGHIVNVLPPEVSVRDLQYLLSPEHRLIVTDGQEFSLDINEFGQSS